MTRSRPKIEFIQLDERNALLFNDTNTTYILGKLKEASSHPVRHKEIYAEMSKHFLVDSDKIDKAILMYVDRMRKDARLGGMRTVAGGGRGGAAGADKGGATQVKEDAAGSTEGIDEKLLLAELCRRTGHRYLTISLSHRRGYRECERCGKVESQYKI